jgi:hypothetical protein
MRSTTRLLLAVAAISAVSIPVAHAQFGGFGGSPGTSTSSGGLPGLNGGGFGGGSPGFSNPFSNGLPGLGALSRDNAANDTADTKPAPAPAPAPQATTTDWVCPDGYTFQLDDNGNWVRDDAGVPQCVEASILDDF